MIMQGNSELRTVVCRYGARLLLKGDPDPTAPLVSILVCPIHNDKITVQAGWPRRRWSYVRTLSQGKTAERYLPARSQFHRELRGTEYKRVRDYRREHRIR